MRNALGFFLSLIVLFLPLAAGAVTVEKLDVTFVNDSYHADMVAHLRAPPEKVHEALTDFDGLAKLNPRILDSEVVTRDVANGDIQVRTRVRVCVAFFCRNVTRVETLTIGKHRIHARIVPEASDFRDGQTVWLITPERGGTRLEVHIRMTPDEGIPGLVKDILADNLCQQLRRTLARLEATETVPDPPDAGCG